MAFEKNLQRGVYFLFFAANLGVLYLLVPFLVILQFAYGVSALALLLMFSGILFNRSRLSYLNPLKWKPLMRPSLGISKDSLKLTRRYSLLAIFTLMIATASVSQVVLLSDGIQRQFILDNTERYDLPTLVVEALSEPSRPPEPYYIRSNISVRVSERIDEIVLASTKSSGLNLRIERKYSIIMIKDLITRDIGGPYESAIIGINQSLFEEIWGNDYVGEFPRNNKSVFAVVYPFELGDRQPEWFVGKSANVPAEWKNERGIEERLYAFWNISGFKIMESIAASSFMPFGIGDIPPIVYIVPFEWVDMYREVYENTPTEVIIKSYYHDWKEQPDILAVANGLESMGQELVRNSKKLESPYPEYKIKSADSPIYAQLTDLGIILAKVRSMLLLFISPLIILGAFVALYALNLVEYRKKHLINIMKTRGIGSDQVAFALFIEATLVGVLSFVGGLVVSALSVFALKQYSSNPLLSNMTFALKSPRFILSSLAFAVVLTYDLSYGRIKFLSRISIKDAENPEFQSIPFWKKYFLDIFSLLLGIIGLIGLHVLITRTTVSSLNVFVLLNASLVMILIMIGAVLSFYRFFAPISKLIAGILYNTIGTLSTLNVRGISLRREGVSQLASIVLLASMFGMVLMLVPPSLEQSAQAQIYYEVGADVRISSIATTWNGTDYTIAQNVSGLKAVTGGMLLDLVISSYAQDEFHVTLLGIDPKTYFTTAYLPEGLSASSAKEIQQLLSENPQNALFWEQDRSKLNSTGKYVLSLRDRYNIGITHDFLFNLKGSFNYWPILIPSRSMVDGIRLVTSINQTWAIYDIVRKQQIDQFDLFALGKILPGYSPSNVSTSLRVAFSPYGSPIAFAVDKISLSSEDTALGLAMPYFTEIGTLSIIVVLLVSFILYGLTSARSRKNEISLYKTLGMTRSQLVRMFLLELIYVTLFSAFIGYFIGVQLATLFKAIVVSSGFYNALPPVRITIQGFLIQRFYGVIGSIAFITSIFPILLLARLKPGDLLRQE